MPFSFALRFAVFFLASLSFACLLGEFYGLWKMRPFACWVLVPAIAILAAAAWRGKNTNQPFASWIIEGTLGGVFAAVVYDLFRLPFVMSGYPLFAVFPKFGLMLLGLPLDLPAQQIPLAAHILGWIYHFVNGASLGIMFLAMCPKASKKALIGGAIGWALVVEFLLLVTPYYTFFKLHLDPNIFLVLTLSAHMIFGVALGIWLWKRRDRLQISSAYKPSA